MSWFRYLLPPLFLCPAVLLTGALGRHAGHSPAPGRPPTLATSVADPAAAQVLDRAIESLKPERIGWTEAQLWQKVVGEDISYQAEGRYLTGPDHHVHLCLTVHLGSTRGTLQVISDGTTLWEETQIDGKDRVVTQTELAAVCEALAQSTVPSQVRTECFQELCISGLAPWLQSVRRQMTVTHQEMVSWNMHDVIRLTLVWNARTAAALVPPGEPWPAYLPRKCLLYLDAETYWPYRLEWWGPGRVPGRDIQVYQMEFREPVFNPSLSRERCAREFTPEHIPGEVPDRTEAYTDEVEARVKEAALANKAVPQ